MGRTEEANEHFRMVVDVEPSHTLARVALAEGLCVWVPHTIIIAKK